MKKIILLVSMMFLGGLIVQCGEKLHSEGMNPCSPAAMMAMKHEAHGKMLWKDKKLGTTGKSCETCHSGGNLLNYKSYPKFIKMANKKMSTLEDMVNFCIITPLKGKPLAKDSKEMKSLVAHYNKLSKMPKNPCGMNPCSMKNPCGMNPCARNPCGM